LLYADKAIALVCNGYSGDDCTSQDMLNFLGSTNNGVAPLNMDFHQIGNNTEETARMNLKCILNSIGLVESKKDSEVCTISQM